MAPGATFADRFGAITPAQTMGRASAAAGATAQASHSSAARNAGATPSHIDPASLPPGPLNQADYARVGERNRYLASKYDPNNLYDRFINSFTGAMNDPANVRTPSEQAEHEALSQKLIDTVFPQPTVAEARLDAMEASPLGTAAWLGARQLGGSERAQAFALDVGRSVEGPALSRAGGQVLGIGASRPPTALGRVRGPQFYDLRDHAIRHGGGLTPDQYYDQAVKHMQTGRRSTFYHNGQFKDAFITRTGPDSFTFTSANKNGRQIFTHMDKDVTTDYLRNRGITLPKGF
jgi:hypothetical protein